MKAVVRCIGAALMSSAFIMSALVSRVEASGAVSASVTYQQMLSKLRSVKTYQVTIKDTTVLQPNDPGAKPRTIESTDEVSFEKPNLFSLKNDGLMGGASIVSNGKNEFFYSDLTDEYSIQNAPKDMVGSVTTGLQGKNVSWTTLTSTVLDGISVKKLSGVISTARGATLVTLYIKQSDSLPYQVRLVLPKFSTANGDGLQVTRTELFTNQRINAPVPDGRFQFIPPDGATKVDSPADLTSGFGGSGLG